MKKFIWFLASLVVLLIAASFFIYFKLKPDYDGQKTLSGLSSEVEIIYDSYGIPHIYGDNEPDAFRALGYVHAQDRLWQMELLRRIGKGQLSELFGQDLIATDKFFLALGIDEASKKTVAILSEDDASVLLAKAYLEGINHFIEEGPTPVEFYLTGIDKTRYELQDVYNVMGYMAFSFAMAHKTDPLLTKIENRLGEAYLNDLAVFSDSSTVWLKNYRQNDSTKVVNQWRNTVFETLQQYHIPQLEGSNGWVMGPEKTKNNKVIFANDPHIGYSQPSVWYEAHLNTPNYEMYGYHMALIPYPILGHNRQMAYGMTMFENDDVDFYFETPHPSDSTKYADNSGWASFETHAKTIKVKDGDDIEFQFKTTNRGPILNGIADQIDFERPVSMWWIYTQEENRLLGALHQMCSSNNMNEFKNGVKNIHAPGLNIMYGDADDNYAWWASAKLYQIPDSVHTKLIFDENNRLSVNRPYLSFSQNPQAENPPQNYVYSANNQPDSIAGMLYPGYYLPEDRAKRITSLIDKKDDWDVESVSALINDVTSPVDREVISMLLSQVQMDSLSERHLNTLDGLKQWDADYHLDNTEALLYHKWIYQLLKDVFLDELGKELFDQLMTTHLIKRSIAPLVGNEVSVWWDDKKTDKEENASDIITSAFLTAYNEVTQDFGKESKNWKWEKVHTVEHGHPIGQVEALRSIFNVGPFPIPGSREVINNTFFPYSDENEIFKVSSGPSTRRIIDFSDVENSRSVLPTGQSGNPFSPHYDDQALMYAQGKFRKMMINRDEIEENANARLVLEPSE